jgi:hypothetical protein
MGGCFYVGGHGIYEEITIAQSACSWDGGGYFWAVNSTCRISNISDSFGLLRFDYGGATAFRFTAFCPDVSFVIVHHCVCAERRGAIKQWFYDTWTGGDGETVLRDSMFVDQNDDYCGWIDQGLFVLQSCRFIRVTLYFAELDSSSDGYLRDGKIVLVDCALSADSLPARASAAPGKIAFDYVDEGARICDDLALDLGCPLKVVCDRGALVPQEPKWIDVLPTASVATGTPGESAEASPSPSNLQTRMFNPYTRARRIRFFSMFTWIVLL